MKRLAKRVLLIGWDGADWKVIQPLLDCGHLPNLNRFLNAGVMGNVASLSPMLSPILWTSIATGKHADRHQILGFAEPDGSTGGLRPVSSTSRRSRAIWSILSDCGLRCGILNWFASHPAEPIRGFVVTDRFPHPVGAPDQEWPVPTGSVYPWELAADLATCRVHPAATTRLQVLPFVPKLAVAPPSPSDTNLQQLRALLASTATTHSAATWLMHTQEWDFMAVYYDAIDRFSHTFMEYHPPKMDHVTDEDFDLYKDVVTGCYRFHDMMLGRLLELAGDDATVIILSDHGFHCDHLRPRGSSKIKGGWPAAWHRLHGILAIRGPGIRKDQRVYGASLLDIAPTILTLLGYPIPRDMDGHVLTQIFEESPQIDSIETYETPAEAAPSPTAEDDPWIAQRMLSQLAALGYVEADNTEEVVLDRARNLGMVYASTGRPQLAIEQYNRVLESRPGDKGCRMAVAACLLQMGKLDECEAIVSEVLTGAPDAPLAGLYGGMIAFRRGDPKRALQLLRRAEKADPRLPGLHCQIGNVYLRQRRWVDAERAFRKALEIDGDSPEAHDGLGVAYRRQKRPAEAVHEHMQSVGLLHFRPQTHFHLGLALAEVGEIDWAIRAFHVSLEQNPRNPLPHRCLAQLYARARNDSAKAQQHLQLAAELLQARREADNR